MTAVEIQAMKDGPTLVVLDGSVRSALCRCGASAKKRYCDGTHTRIGFHAGAGKFERPTVDRQLPRHASRARSPP